MVALLLHQFQVGRRNADLLIFNSSNYFVVGVGRHGPYDFGNAAVLPGVFALLRNSVAALHLRRFQLLTVILVGAVIVVASVKFLKETLISILETDSCGGRAAGINIPDGHALHYIYAFFVAAKPTPRFIVSAIASTKTVKINNLLFIASSKIYTIALAD